MNIYNNNLDFNKYKVFYAVAECQSFSKAAEVLYISQPAISHAIKELENGLNIKLFISESSKVRLTEDGEKLLHYVENAFSNILMAERVLKENKDELNGEIRIGMYSHISLFLLPNIMHEFSSMYPDAKFYVYSTSNSELKEKLKNRELDFIVLQFPIFIDDSGRYKEEILCELETCFYSNEYYYDLYLNKGKSVEYPVIVPSRGFTDIDSIEETLKKNKIKINKKYRIYTSELIKELAKEGLGIGWGLKRHVKKELEDKELYEVPIDIPKSNTIFSISYDMTYMNKTAIKFLEYFMERVKEEYK